MSGFQKRVALLEKWAPNLLPQIKNIDDLADIILDVWDEAKEHTEQGIIALLEDLKPSCYCDDCRDESERSGDYLTAIQELIKGDSK